MILEEVFKDLIKKKNVVLVGIPIDGQSRELLGWALVKVAEPGDCVIAVHVSRSSDYASKAKTILDGYLDAYEGICDMKKVDVISHVLTGRSIRKALVKEAKNHATVAIVVGTSKPNALGGWDSTAKFCAKKLPPTTDVVAIHNGKIVYKRCTSNQLPGMVGLTSDPRPSFSQIENLTPKGSSFDFGDSEADTETVKSFSDMAESSQDGSKHVSDQDLKNGQKRVPGRSTSLGAGEHVDKSLGWPLLRRASSANPQLPFPATRDMSVVQWVMTLPDRSPQQSPQCSTIKENPFERTISDIVDESIKGSFSCLDELTKRLKNILETSSSGCRWFSHDVLKTSTAQFSSENLIGKGGCNLVFKGTLPDGKQVAVKLMKSSKEAWKDFAHEVDIISTLKHESILPLLGFCIEDNVLISVYDFLPKGSLEGNIHGKNKEKSALPWEVRFNVAIRIAEALNYLHNECPQPVIHRDVKSSNILLTKDFEPQLSDFGLAIWGPTATSFLTESDVVGTFGYLAPEYFMYGKISDKIDVYAFGVVLLELLSGRKPVGSETPKEQESLVMWAKPKIESGDVKDILDPNLDGKFDEVQVLRMVHAAKLCITRSARLRPKMSEILKLLKGESDVDKQVNSLGLEDSENRDGNDDEVYPNSSAELHLSLALLDVDDDKTSPSSAECSNSVSWEAYLKGRWSRSSSFD